MLETVRGRGEEIVKNLDLRLAISSIIKYDPRAQAEEEMMHRAGAGDLHAQDISPPKRMIEISAATFAFPK